MTSALFLLGVVLSSVTVYTQDVEPQAGFEVDMLVGKWYDIGFASNYPIIMKQLPTMQMGFYTMTPLANGDIKMAYERFVAGAKCKTENLLMKKGRIPGVYAFDSHGLRIIWIFKEVSANYAIMFYYMNKGTDDGTLTKLIARTQQPRGDVKNKWKKFAESIGVRSENIVFPPKREGCKA